MKLVLLVVLACLTTGCISDAAVIEALAKDTATVCVRIVTIYGTITAARTNIIAGDVQCDSLTVKSQGVTTVPVTVVPSTTQTPVPVIVVPTK